MYFRESLYIDVYLRVTKKKCIRQKLPDRLKKRSEDCIR